MSNPRHDDKENARITVVSGVSVRVENSVILVTFMYSNGRLQPALYATSNFVIFNMSAFKAHIIVE